ncbi:hypothetical protein SAY87_010890 [Trapa incisa]|nr:hypothetical protein SAY87_010890 [Trapa incisa]
MAMADQTNVKLLGMWASPFVRRVQWALSLKGVISYDYVEEDILNKSSLLLELNPVHQKVPVLIHDGKVICESLVILEYMDETWKGIPLLPHDPHGRAMARFWARFSDEKLEPNAWTAMCSEGEEKEGALKRAIEAASKIEEQLIKGRRFFGGDDIGYLDVAMGWVACWLPVWEEVGAMSIVDPARHPRITSWAGDFLSHPLIRTNLPPKDEMVDYFHGKRKRIMAH